MFFEVPLELYDEIRTRLTEAVGDENYFSGTLAFPFKGIFCRLRTSVIVYRRTERLPEGTFSVIDDLVPVWWEFHSSSAQSAQTFSPFILPNESPTKNSHPHRSHRSPAPSSPQTLSP